MIKTNYQKPLKRKNLKGLALKMKKVEIHSIEGYSERQIAADKKKNSVLLAAMTCRKRRYKKSVRRWAASIVEDRYLIVSNKRSRRKSAPDLTAEFNSTCYLL